MRSETKRWFDEIPGKDHEVWHYSLHRELLKAVLDADPIFQPILASAEKPKEWSSRFSQTLLYQESGRQVSRARPQLSRSNTGHIWRRKKYHNEMYPYAHLARVRSTASLDIRFHKKLS